MADSSLETAKDTLEIHSLSKVFKDEIGKHIVGGVIKGIEAEVPKLKNHEEDVRGSCQGSR